MKVPYYIVVKGRGYFAPSKRMKDAGFKVVSCGKDGPSAMAKAAALYAKWKSGVNPETAIRDQEGYVYFLVQEDRVKIGFTTSPGRRFKDLQTGSAEQPDAIVTVRGTRQDEKRLHDRLAPFRMEGEWFRLAHPVSRMMARCLLFRRVNTAVTEPDREQKSKLRDEAPVQFRLADPLSA